MKDRLAETTPNVKKGGAVRQIVLLQREGQVLADLLLGQDGLRSDLECTQEVP